MSMTREMTLTEKDSLRQLLSQSPLSLQNWLVALVAGFVICGFITSMVARHIVCLNVPQQWYFLTSLLFVWIIASIFIYKYLRKVGEYSQIEKDINIGIVNITRYEYKEAMILGSIEEADFAFVLKSKNNKAHFFIGESYYEAYEEKKFPSTEIEFIDSVHSRLELQCTYIGDYLNPTKKISLKKNETIGFEKDREEWNWNDFATKFI